MCVSEEQLSNIANNAYYAYYLHQVAKSLISFEMLYEDTDKILSSEKATVGTAIQKVAYDLLIDRNIISKEI